jgi:hypothetical protein
VPPHPFQLISPVNHQAELLRKITEVHTTEIKSGLKDESGEAKKFPGRVRLDLEGYKSPAPLDGKGANVTSHLVRSGSANTRIGENIDRLAYVLVLPPVAQHLCRSRMAHCCALDVVTHLRRDSRKHELLVACAKLDEREVGVLHWKRECASNVNNGVCTASWLLRSNTPIPRIA